ncbi:hypothetical protein ACQ4PT_051620 [Festuca glaucescens]
MKSSSVSVKKKLSFAAIMAYPACEGYEYQATAEEASDFLLAGYSCPQIARRARVVIPDRLSPPEGVSLQFGNFQTPDGAALGSKQDNVDQSNISDAISQQPSSVIADDVDFMNLIDDMTLAVWRCRRCLNMSHDTDKCVNKIRCKSCYRYGHYAKQCLDRSTPLGKRWVPKQTESSGAVLESADIVASSTSAASFGPGSLPLSDKPPPPSVPPPPPPIPNNLLQAAEATTMANFEFDPAPWVPAGFHIIDGGPNRLPRTFVTPSAPMVDAHEGWAVAMIDPPPPEHLLHEAMEQVRNFLLDRDLEVVNSLPWFCGVGAFQFRNPVVRAALVDHGVWQLGGAVLRFIKHNEGVGFRTQHGARTGWLMFIGTPMDFRNTETIAEAVNTFGEFHYWQHRDIQKCRILVYATFPSPSQVPRDVVFRQPKVARFAGLRHSWTAPVYILSAEMADVHPADEDPMPLDGNPHPLPGNLQPNNVNVALPEFPEVGWNVPPMEMDQPAPFVDQPLQQGGEGDWDHHLENSDVLSAISSASVAPPVPIVMAANEFIAEANPVQQPGELVGVLQQVDVAPAAVREQMLLVQPGEVAMQAVAPVQAEAAMNDAILLQEVVVVEVGQGVNGNNADEFVDDEPVDEEIIVEEMGPTHAEEVLQAGEQIPQPVVPNVAAFVFQSQVLQSSPMNVGAIVPYKAKRTWVQAFSQQTENFSVSKLADTEEDICLRPKLAFQLNRVMIIDNVKLSAGQANPAVSLQTDAPLCLGGTQVHKGKQISHDSPSFVVGMSDDAQAQKKQRRKKVPVVVPGPRRFTRSQLLLDGHRATPLPGLSPRPRKKSKKGPVAEPARQPDVNEPAPPTPLPVLQKIGAMLDIDPALLTTEKLMTPVDSEDAVKSVNDK